MIRLPGAWLAGALFLAAGVDVLRAQEMEPRRWTHLPVGTNVAGLGYLYSDGELHVDPLLEIEDGEFQLQTVVASYNRYFGLFDRTARLDVQIPWQSGRWEGLLSGVPTSVRRDGFADPRIRLSVLLAGGPAMEGAEFAGYLQEQESRTVVGAALAVRVPLGEYMDDKLINLGENRFSLQPQLGVVHYEGPWSFEATGSFVVPTANDDFFGGRRLEQDPLYALQLHVVRSFEGGFWISGGAAYGRGSRSEIDGVEKDDERSNLLWGASAGFSLERTHSFRLGYLRQDALRDIGVDAHTVLLTWGLVF